MTTGPDVRYSLIRGALVIVVFMAEKVQASVKSRTGPGRARSKRSGRHQVARNNLQLQRENKPGETLGEREREQGHSGR